MDDRLQMLNGIRIERFSYNVSELQEKADAGEELNGSTAIQEGAYYVLFKPADPPFEAKVLRINSATCILLNTCDGSKNVGETIASVERQLDATDLQGPLLAAMDRLLTIGAVHLLRN
jgi:hypothetical protein